jgi:hypothetical protein
MNENGRLAIRRFRFTPDLPILKMDDLTLYSLNEFSQFQEFFVAKKWRDFNEPENSSLLKFS